MLFHQPLCYAGVPLHCTLHLQISVPIQTLNLAAHLLLPIPLICQIATPGIQATREVEALILLTTEPGFQRAMGKVWEKCKSGSRERKPIWAVA